MKKIYPIIDGERIFKATNVIEIHPVYLEIANNLSQIEILKYIKILNGRIQYLATMNLNFSKEKLCFFCHINLKETADCN